MGGEADFRSILQNSPFLSWMRTAVVYETFIDRYKSLLENEPAFVCIPPLNFQGAPSGPSVDALDDHMSRNKRFYIRTLEKTDGCDNGYPHDILMRPKPDALAFQSPACEPENLSFNCEHVCTCFGSNRQEGHSLNSDE